MSAIRTVLDRFYDGCAVLAAGFLVAIGVLILLQASSRWLGIGVQALSDYAGYCMAASSFLAFAHTFRRGGHIRVRLMLQHLQGARRRVAELWCLGAGGFLAGYLAWFSIKMVRVSYTLGDVSEGPDATPLWIPQIGMAFGASVLFVALVDAFIRVALGGPLDEGDDGVLQKE